MDFLLHHLLRASAERSPDKEALVHKDRRLSYREVWQEVDAIAEGLRKAGCRRQDRIGIWLRPSMAQALAIFAVSRAGGAFVPIHHSLFPDQVAHIVDDCGMTGLITDRTLAGRAGEALEERPSLDYLVLDEEPGEPVADLHHHYLPSLRLRPSAAACADPGIDRDLAAILYTSGSTGKPKGIMLSHANLIAGTSIVSDYLGITDRDRLLAALPFSFDAGLNQLTTAIQQRGTLVLCDFVIANEIAPLAIEERITGLAGVPTLWNLITQTRSFKNKQFPDLRYVTNTGGAVSPALLDRLRRTFPDAEIFLMYGLTEAFRSTYLPPAELARRPTSMGKAIPNTEILVLGADGERCAPGEVGELVHHGPTVALGYWGNEAATEAVFRPHPFAHGGAPGQRVVYSGDLVRTDDEGFLYFVGRRDQLIKSSGFRISPTEVEAQLLASNLVREAAVIGIPDEMLGHRIKAFVVARDDTELDPERLLDFCRERMPGYMVPQQVAAIEALPKTPNGKVDYEALRSRDGTSAAPGTEMADPHAS